MLYLDMVWQFLCDGMVHISVLATISVTVLWQVLARSGQCWPVGRSLNPGCSETNTEILKCWQALIHGVWQVLARSGKFWQVLAKIHITVLYGFLTRTAD